MQLNKQEGLWSQTGLNSEPSSTLPRCTDRQVASEACASSSANWGFSPDFRE